MSGTVFCAAVTQIVFGAVGLITLFVERTGRIMRHTVFCAAVTQIVFGAVGLIALFIERAGRIVQHTVFCAAAALLFFRKRLFRRVFRIRIYRYL